ncbi:endonuclease/exonuclease/phosphatase family protein [Thalassovita sp.]|uniref:endonuclease/exonuclease/phosphatase family protein n=1 Tax=Thalassovita sp. TaxID=1979401 RepID=UPI003B59898A
MLRDILRADPQVLAVAKVISQAAPDVILLQGMDYDRGLQSAQALRQRISEQGLDLPHLFAFAPNTGVRTGFDLNGDGRRHGPEDAHGYGRFAGQGGMVLLSRYPFRNGQDFSGQLWSDLADPQLIQAKWDDGGTSLRLASVGHWQVQVMTPHAPITLVAFHATPPVFDGPEDRNGLRNAHQLAAVTRNIGGLDGRFVLLGDANNDPDKGEGRKPAIKALLGHPKLQDPLQEEPTVDWRKLGLGWMRVDYALPSTDLNVVAAGRHMAPPAAAASRHRLVWVDVLP